MSEKTVTLILGIALMAFIVAIFILIIKMPFGLDTRTTYTNADIIGLLLSPVSMLIGALLRGVVKGKRHDNVKDH